MSDTFCCPPEAENEACELPAVNVQHPTPVINTCPVCGNKGKPVQGQTVKTILSVSLREVQNTQYLFCKTPTCEVVYFSSDGQQIFTKTQVREKVYQKEPGNDDVFICYCFRHKVGDIRTDTTHPRAAIVDDINTGIQAGQCACDLRNPQGSCCLGNVLELIKDCDPSTV